MAELSDDDIRTTARLCRLAVGDDELPKLAAELSSIVDHIASLSAVDTDGIEPMTHAGGGSRLREDRVEPSLPAERALAAAPDGADGYFRVPNILVQSD